MMLSSSQVLDHQLIFHIMYGLGQFHHRQNKAEKRGDLAKKKQQLLSKHRAAADGKNSQKTTALVSLLAETMHPRLSQNIRLTLLFKVKRIK